MRSLVGQTGVDAERSVNKLQLLSHRRQRVGRRPNNLMSMSCRYNYWDNQPLKLTSSAPRRGNCINVIYIRLCRVWSYPYVTEEWNTLTQWVKKVPKGFEPFK